MLTPTSPTACTRARTVVWCERDAMVLATWAATSPCSLPYSSAPALAITMSVTCCMKWNVNMVATVDVTSTKTYREQLFVIVLREAGIVYRRNEVFQRSPFLVKYVP